MTSSFRCPFRNCTTGICSCLANRSIAATNAFVIGSISAEEANGWPRWLRKNFTTPLSHCNGGTYTFRYIRSTHSSSNVTCLFRISATLCGTLISGSGTTPVLRDRPPLQWLYHWQELLSVLHRPPEPSPRIINYCSSAHGTSRRSEAEPSLGFDRLVFCAARSTITELDHRERSTSEPVFAAGSV